MHEIEVESNAFDHWDGEMGWRTIPEQKRARLLKNLSEALVLLGLKLVRIEPMSHEERKATLLRALISPRPSSASDT